MVSRTWRPDPPSQTALDLNALLLLVHCFAHPRTAAMSFLRSQSSLRLSRACTQIPRSSRWLSSTPQRRLGEPDPKAIPDVKAMQMTEDQASMVEVGRSPEGAVEQFHPSHQPDYTATIDHGTSKYSPVPKRVMNGSEPTEITPAAVLSGAPVDLQARTVRYAQNTEPRQPLKEIARIGIE